MLLVLAAYLNSIPGKSSLQSDHKGAMGVPVGLFQKKKCQDFLLSKTYMQPHGNAAFIFTFPHPLLVPPT
jgi:hypothetical protein